MTQKKTIRVIKKGERGRQEPAAPKVNVARDTARDMVHTVTNWVDEFKQRRREETAAAIKTLISETPRPNEA
jgi:hypothetical protein